MSLQMKSPPLFWVAMQLGAQSQAESNPLAGFKTPQQPARSVDKWHSVGYGEPV